MGKKARIHPHNLQVKIFDWKKFAQHVRVGTRALNMSQAQVAKACYVGPERISHLVSKRRPCDLNTVLKLCIYLQLQPEAYCVPYRKWGEVAEGGEIKAR